MHSHTRTTRPLAAVGIVRRSEGAFVALAAVVALAAGMLTKQYVATSNGLGSPALAATLSTGEAVDAGDANDVGGVVDPLNEPAETAEEIAAASAELALAPARVFEPDSTPPEFDPQTRWFNGRPIRPVRTMQMVVTAYSPDARSCAGTDDGITASLHHVSTNGHRSVAADTRLLPLGSMLTIPGYDADRVVPVLDRGGAIKGRRLDVLFPTHAEARAWGVKKVTVTVWGYADGEASCNWRQYRDGKK